MLNRINLVFIITIAALTSSCAHNNINHIDASARDHIDEVDAYLAVTQDEIYADIDKSTTSAAGGGLLFALIDAAVDNSRTEDAEELIKPIRNSLIDFDYAETLQANIEKSFDEIKWMDVKKIELERSIGDGHILNKIKSSKVSAVLFMTVDYKLSSNFNAVTTNVALIMFPNKEALYKFKESLDNNENPADHSDNIYSNNITVTIPLGLGSDKEANASTLANSNAAEVKTALEKSAKKIAQDIIIDIQAEDKKG